MLLATLCILNYFFSEEERKNYPKFSRDYFPALDYDIPLFPSVLFFITAKNNRDKIHANFSFKIETFSFPLVIFLRFYNASSPYKSFCHYRHLKSTPFARAFHVLPKRERRNGNGIFHPPIIKYPD